MGWDRKKRGPASGYYYRSVRTATGVKKVYYGRNTAGQLAAAVEGRREARKAARQAADEEGNGEAEQLTAELNEWESVLSAAWLVLSGHHNHHGCWRRKKRGEEAAQGGDASVGEVPRPEPHLREKHDPLPCRAGRARGPASG